MDIWNNDKNLIVDEVALGDIKDAFAKVGSHQIYGVSSTQKTFFTCLATDVNTPLLIIVRDNSHKEQWLRDLAFFSPTRKTYEFPLLDKTRFAVTAKSMEIQAKSMLALSRLLDGGNIAVVATVEEAAQRIFSAETMLQQSVLISKSDTIERNDLLEALVTMAYERTDRVDQRGHFSVRGDIVDIFPVSSLDPVRIEFFGDEVDTIRTFSVDTQRSIDYISDIRIFPFHIDDEKSNHTILSYGGKGSVIIDEPKRLQEALQSLLLESSATPGMYCQWRELMDSTVSKRAIFLSYLQQRIPYVTVTNTIGVNGKSMVSFERQIPLLMEEIKHWLSRKYTIVLVLHNEQRRRSIVQALEETSVSFTEIPPEVQAEAPKGELNQVVICAGLITEGFELPHLRLAIVAEQNIYGQQKRRLQRQRNRGKQITYFSDLKPGDYVVHSIHGIGKYVGLKNIETEGIHRDYVEIDYAGTDRLFLPTENLHQLQKYIGHEGTAPKLNKMGGADWTRATKKAQQSIDDLADKLVSLYAKRELIDGYAFLPDQPWQQEFEEAFPYEETPDQLHAIEEIKESMEKPKPMDRLLCGDVGFGKTEVAMRAAFKAVLSGKQVAVLVPTTILAQQHYQTFLRRFSNFGVVVNVLNRFRTSHEKKEIVTAVKNGSIDILIGTHALLNKNIGFKNLGFLVVDEEQRFGVAQKEKWKEWASHIDVLTLSATPIPRTLHMSLVGVRELSVINTPPEDRLPVQTYVVEYDMEVITEAIRREIARGGQVYFVYNRVQSIYRMGEKLEAAMPGLRYCIAHGQMSGTEMEGVMVDFYEGYYDVLLCTSIIENGIDVANANTIIVFDADRLGLSQLYQMRGRVGRSYKRAYAYFLYRRDKVLTEAAEKRLQAVKEFTELGAGFKIAMRDLEIRGAGSLLGSQQHGNIAAVGFAMYCAMLEEAIAKAQHKEPTKETVVDPSLDLKVNAYFDDDYIGDSANKITMYQRMLYIKTKEDLDDFVEELIDRFGHMTQPVEHLVRLAYIKEEARLLGIRSIQLRATDVEIIWADDSLMATWDMAKVTPSYWKRMRFKKGKPTTLRVDIAHIDVPMLTFVENVVKELMKK